VPAGLLQPTYLSVINATARAHAGCARARSSRVVEEWYPGVTDPGCASITGASSSFPSCWHCNPFARAVHGGPGPFAEGRGVNNRGDAAFPGASPFPRRCSPVNHHMVTSAFPDHAVVSRYSLVNIDPDLPLDEAALFVLRGAHPAWVRS